MKGVLLLALVFLLLITGCTEKDPDVLFGDDVGDAADEGIRSGDASDAANAARDQIEPTEPPTARETKIRAAEFEPAARCGDGLCEGTENECSCAQDCGECATKDAGMCASYECTPLDACVKTEEPTCCGDGLCEGSESCQSCMRDCCETGKTLGDFPNIADRLTIVVGKNAPAQDIVTAANLASVLKQLGVEVGETKLDEEVVNIANRNYLVVGSPCDNAAVAQLLGIAKHKNPCGVIPKYEGQIWLIPTSEENVALLVTGETWREVERAAKRLVNYQQRPLRGTMVKV